MPTWLVGQADTLVGVGAKALLMYGTAVLGLRIAHRRTLSQWTAIDFAAAVAIGAVMGRTAVAEGQSLLVGAVALVTFLAAHALVTLGRGNRWIAKAVDHRVRVLVDHGRLRRDQLRLCGLTENDVVAKLRELGVRELGDLRYVLYETKGELTVVRETGDRDGALVRAGLADAAGFRPQPTPPGAADPRS
ncbi:DUF421 domain-containing protein [Geodermatophilus sp. SYSU D00684]